MAPLAIRDEDGSIDLGGGESREASLGAIEVVPSRMEAEHPRPAALPTVEARVALRAFEAQAALLELLARDPESSPDHLDLTNESLLALRIPELADDRELRGQPPQGVAREPCLHLTAHDVELGTREPSSSPRRAPVGLANFELLDESRPVLDEHRRRPAYDERRRDNRAGSMTPAPHGGLILDIRERKDRTMRKLVVSTFLTLDGVMQAPGGPTEDTDGDFALGGWSVNYWDDRMVEVMAEATSKPFAMVLGRKSYDILAAHWPHASEDEGASIFNNATKYVASRGRPTLEWENSVLLEGDAAEALAELKKKDGPELQVVGSSDLIQSLLRAGIVDEYRLWLFPLVIGSGKKLFGDGTLPAGLKLVDSTLSTTGVVMATFEPAGDVVPGSFALE